MTQVVFVHKNFVRPAQLRKIIHRIKTLHKKCKCPRFFTCRGVIYDLIKTTPLTTMSNSYLCIYCIFYMWKFKIGCLYSFLKMIISKTCFSLLGAGTNEPSSHFRCTSLVKSIPLAHCTGFVTFTPIFFFDILYNIGSFTNFALFQI